MMRFPCTLVCFTLASFASAAAESPNRPNFVLIMCDDLGWGDVGFNGNEAIETPHLDEMADESLRFTRFYAASAVCSPTRGSVITGRHPSRYGITTANAGHMLPEEQTLAELLRSRGYVTGHFGKWHLGTLTKTVKDSNRGGPRNVEHYSPPWAHGFDVCFSTEAKVPTFDPMLKPPGKVSGKGWDFITDKSGAAAYGTHYWNEQGEIVRLNLEGDDSRIIMDRAIPFLQTAVHEQRPFLAIVWFHAPHLPVVAGPKHAQIYAEYDSYRKNYYGCITALDEQVGRLRETLRRLGVAKNTLVTFCSDNGPEGRTGEAPGSAGPYRGRKRDLFEGGVRVPGLIEWPAKITPGTTDFPAVTSDYLPTILDILELPRPDDRPLDGISLLPLFDGKLNERPEPIAFAFRGKLALSDNRYKLVHYPAGMSEGNDEASLVTHDEAEYFLYDLLSDPGESTDIAAQHPKIVHQMRKTLEAWQRSCHDQDQSNPGTDSLRPSAKQ